MEIQISDILVDVIVSQLVESCLKLPMPNRNDGGNMQTNVSIIIAL